MTLTENADLINLLKLFQRPLCHAIKDDKKQVLGLTFNQTFYAPSIFILNTKQNKSQVCSMWIKWHAAYWGGTNTGTASTENI